MYHTGHGRRAADHSCGSRIWHRDNQCDQSHASAGDSLFVKQEMHGAMQMRAESNKHNCITFHARRLGRQVAHASSFVADVISMMTTPRTIQT